MNSQTPQFLGPPRSLVLRLPTSVRLRASPELFWRICCENPDLRLKRTASGRLEVLPPAWTITGAKNACLSGQLWNWNEAAGAGFALGSAVGYTLPNGAVRSPDASWMTLIQHRSMTPEQRQGFPSFCPTFVAELRSEGDRLRTLRRKMREYCGQGAQLGWLIDLVTKRVEVYRPDQAVRVFENPSSLPGEDVLPGFELDLRFILSDDLLA